MNSFLDIRTLSLMMGVISAAFSIGMIYLYLHHKTYSGFLDWCVASFFGGMGGILLCLRGYVPSFLSIIGANLSIVLFFGFIYWGIVKFTDRESSKWIDIVLISAFLVSFVKYTYCEPHIDVRIVIVSALCCYFCLRSYWVLKEYRAKAQLKFLLYTLLGSGAFFLIRSLFSYSATIESHDFMKSGAFQAFAFILFIVNQVLVTIALIVSNYHKIESDLMRSSDLLRDNEEKFRGLSNAAFEGLIIMRNGVILEANSAICSMLGFSNSEIISQPALDFVPESEKENVKQKIISGYELSYESLCVRKDGSIFPVEIQGKMFSYRGETVRVTAIRDVSELKRTTNALREANKKLMNIAMQDGLTQIANRRHFDIKISDEWRRMKRNKQYLSLIIFDVDHFKQYNDTYGHQAGDLCLQKIARKISMLFQRSGDLFARYGGEEFAVILPNTVGEGAITLAERMISHVHALEIRHEASTVSEHVTISCGVASLIPTQSTSPQLLLEMADKALYEAKEAGRDRAISAPLRWATRGAEASATPVT